MSQIFLEAKQPKRISREEFGRMLAAGRKFVHAALYERQDFIVDFGGGLTRPVRDVTNEPDQWGREIIGGKRR